jgi:hypothetical protein
MTHEKNHFITKIYRRGGGGGDIPHLLYLPPCVAKESQLAYVHRYISLDIIDLSDFQVTRGQMCIHYFGVDEVMCLCLMMKALAHHTVDVKCISVSMMYYVDRLFQWPKLIRWSTIFLQQFCISMNRCGNVLEGRQLFSFALELFF